jgi:hypothetical protein
MHPARTLLALCLLTFSAYGQPDQRWLTLHRDDTRLALPALQVSSQSDEVDFAAGDLDQDGWIDVVVARAAPGTVNGARTNLLLRNDHGVLRDQTVALASASDLPGDHGFSTPVHELGVEIADLDGDDRPDVVFAAAWGAGLPKAVSHPRVYRNLGHAPQGEWLGLRHEDARIPQLLDATGFPLAPNFSEVAVGDVDLDGDLDLYFTSLTFWWPTHVPRDRLLLNDGNGYFGDVTLATLTSDQSTTATGCDNAIHDLNMDGASDLLRVGFNSPNLRVIYNDAQNPGSFDPGEQVVPMPQSSVTGGLALGDLNQDGRPDLITSAVHDLNYRLHAGLEPGGNVLWTGMKIAAHVSNALNLPAGNNVHVSDLDLNGFPDVLVTSVQPISQPSESRRAHIYRNYAGAPGVFNVVLKEEAEFENADLSVIGWKGAVGVGMEDLSATYDAAIADFDRDGDPDIVFGRAAGAFYFENRTVVCQSNLGFGGPGDLWISLCGQPLESGGAATFALREATPGATALVFLGLSANPTAVPPFGATLVPMPVALILGLPIPPSGELLIAVPGGGGPLSIYAQAVASDPAQLGGQEVSNALKIDLLP